MNALVAFAFCLLFAVSGFAANPSPGAAKPAPPSPVTPPAPDLAPPPPSSATPPATTAVPPSAPSPLDQEDIRDIRGPVHIPFSWLWIVQLFLGLLALIGLWLLWRWYRRFREARRLARQKTPNEIALERLEKARALMTPEQAHEFAIAVSEAVRLYIEDRFHEQAAHRTTEEFLHDLLTRSGSPLAPHADLLADFLKHCDLAKFARWSFSLPEMEGMHASAIRFVTETKPDDAAGKKNMDNTHPKQ
ncbi:MAG: DUF4381 family protein [Verrucomicrobiae bacterium]|nr:DUF4381 family protein [Verrucomicrobiae bacterium]